MMLRSFDRERIFSPFFDALRFVVKVTLLEHLLKRVSMDTDRHGYTGSHKYKKIETYHLYVQVDE